MLVCSPSPPLSPNCNAISVFDGMSTLLGSFKLSWAPMLLCLPYHLYHPIAMRYLNFLMVCQRFLVVSKLFMGYLPMLQYALPSPPLSPNCNAISKFFDGISTLLGSFQGCNGHYQCCSMLFPHHLYHPIAMRYLNVFDGMSTLLGSFQACNGHYQCCRMLPSPPLSPNCNAISKCF